MSKDNYEAGGKVQISGKWYEVDEQEGTGHLFLVQNFDINGGLNLKYVEDFIQAYEPPKKEPVVHEWLDADQFDSIELKEGRLPSPTKT